MDYFQAGRPQAVNQQSHSHSPYIQYSQGSATSNSQMYYTPHQSTMAQPQQNASYAQHYSMQNASANASLDYGQQNQSMQHVQSSQQRRTPRLNENSNSSNVRLTQQPLQQQEMPLRIVIDSKHVGALIGTGGNNIRDITKESKARVVVDVQRSVKDAQGHSEKIISIFGQQESCSKACLRILQCVQKELEKDENRENTEIELKIRAHNQLVGRLIGKQGATIKKIMQETNTTIFVSNEQSSRGGDVVGSSMLPFADPLTQMERTITVKGANVEAVSAAEQKISSKLRQSYETDLQNRMNLPIPSMAGLLAPMGDAYAAAALSMAMRPPVMNNANSQQVKTTKLWVPNSMVGAIIGSKGTNIRNIIRNSGANIRIDGGERRDKSDEEKSEKEVHEEKGQGDAAANIGEERNKDDERLVTVTGNDSQQYKAQFFIFNRISEQSQQYIDEVKLRIEVTVPSRVVGRIIGKGGQNVRELQRITGASVKIPEEEQHTGERKEDSATSSDEGTMVRIVGSFAATQSVQARIAQLIGELSRTGIHDKKNRDDGNASPVNGAE